MYCRSAKWKQNYTVREIVQYVDLTSIFKYLYRHINDPWLSMNECFMTSNPFHHVQSQLFIQMPYPQGRDDALKNVLDIGHWRRSSGRQLIPWFRMNVVCCNLYHVSLDGYIKGPVHVAEEQRHTDTSGSQHQLSSCWSMIIPVDDK